MSQAAYHTEQQAAKPTLLADATTAGQHSRTANNWQGMYCVGCLHLAGGGVGSRRRAVTPYAEDGRSAQSQLV